MMIDDVDVDGNDEDDDDDDELMAMVVMIFEKKIEIKIFANFFHTHTDTRFILTNEMIQMPIDRIMHKVNQHGQQYLQLLHNELDVWQTIDRQWLLNVYQNP